MTSWTAVVGFSGTGKTPGIDATKRALSQIERSRRDKIAELKRAHEGRVETAKAARAQWKKDLKRVAKEKIVRLGEYRSRLSSISANRPFRDGHHSSRIDNPPSSPHPDGLSYRMSRLLIEGEDSDAQGRYCRRYDRRRFRTGSGVISSRVAWGSTLIERQPAVRLPVGASLPFKAADPRQI